MPPTCRPTRPYVEVGATPKVYLAEVGVQLAQVRSIDRSSSDANGWTEEPVVLLMDGRRQENERPSQGRATGRAEQGPRWVEQGSTPPPHRSLSPRPRPTVQATLLPALCPRPSSITPVPSMTPHRSDHPGPTQTLRVRMRPEKSRPSTVPPPPLSLIFLQSSPRATGSRPPVTATNLSALLPATPASLSSRPVSTHLFLTFYLWALK